ncbi:MAG: hypothetical protein ACYDA1_07745 [Vulcanimicrobiaceae bacterium]
MEFISHVLSQIHRPSRILCDASCSRISDALERAGHEIVPLANRALPKEHLFDVILLDRTLHKASDVDATLRTLSERLGPEGKFIVYDCARETMDRRTARWLYSRREKLHRNAETRLPQNADAFFLQWHEEKSRFTDGLTMERSLLSIFDGHIHREVYCCVELADPEGERAERVAINEGAINAVGFTFVGTID